MVVATGEILAEEFDNMIYPVGSPVLYSAYSVSEMVDGERTERFVMKEGVLVGYDDSFGGIPHIIVESRPEEKVMSGMPKNIPVNCIRNEVELVLVDPSVEKMSDPLSKSDIAAGQERHTARRIGAYLSGGALRTV
jgi:hypothetical protein